MTCQLTIGRAAHTPTLQYGYKPSAKLPLAQAVVTRIVQALSDPTRSAVALHAACRTARLFARARIINSSSHVRGSRQVPSIAE